MAWISNRQPKRSLAKRRYVRLILLVLVVVVVLETYSILPVLAGVLTSGPIMLLGLTALGGVFVRRHQARSATRRLIVWLREYR